MHVISDCIAMSICLSSVQVCMCYHYQSEPCVCVCNQGAYGNIADIVNQFF